MRGVHVLVSWSGDDRPAEWRWIASLEELLALVRDYGIAEIVSPDGDEPHGWSESSVRYQEHLALEARGGFWLALGRE